MIKLLILFCLSTPALAQELLPLSGDILIDAKYSGEDNFVGEKIDGYNANKCLLSPQALKALHKAQQIANGYELSLKIFDCYRPQMAVDHFVRWALNLDDQHTKDHFYPHVDKSNLFKHGYIAKSSGHSRGSTIDLTLAKKVNGAWRELEMGTPFDFFDPKSATNYVVDEKSKLNRLLLKSIMESAGFKNYSKEWWHYTLKNEPYPNRYFNIPID